MIDSLATWLVVALIVIGFAGVFVPLLPGILLIWSAILLYALNDGFATLNPFTFALITVIALAAGSADLWLPLLGAKTTGASRRSLLIGLSGAVIGTFVFPVLGTVAGYAGGILLSEFELAGGWKPALKAAFGGVLGYGLGVAVELAGAVGIVALFLTALTPR